MICALPWSPLLAFAALSAGQSKEQPQERSGGSYTDRSTAFLAPGADPYEARVSLVDEKGGKRLFFVRSGSSMELGHPIP